MDPAALRASGDPIPITVATGVNFSPSASLDAKNIVFGTGTELASKLWQLSIVGDTGKVSDEPRPITDGFEIRQSPFPSHDGKRIVYAAMGSGLSSIRIRDLDSGKETRLTELKGSSYFPILSDDGSLVAYSASQGGGKSSIYSIPARGGLPRKLCDDCGRPIQWTPDNANILIDNAGKRQGDIMILNVATGQSRVLLQHAQLRLFTPRLSSDGRWLCFTAMAGDRARKIYVTPFSDQIPIDESRWVLVVDGTDLERQPYWSPNGSLLYFLSDRDAYRCVWAQKLDPLTRRAAGNPFAVQHFHQARHNLVDFGDVGQIGLSVTKDRMFFAMREIRSNIWVAERQH